MSELATNADDAWKPLRQLTAARIGLGRFGTAIPTGETLRFKLAHARARDAVHAALDHSELAKKFTGLHTPILTLKSQACDRSEYLRRPDFGRQLSEESRSLLAETPAAPVDLAIVIADGLSALAIELNALPFLTAFLPLIPDLQLGSIAIVEQGRVAIGDEIGHRLQARAVVVLIGERPGLSSPDSMGLYLTHNPRPGLTDERRNCISNIRAAGLSHTIAAQKLAWLLQESLRRGHSGVELKDETVTSVLE